MQIYYENFKGDRLNLVEWPYRIYKGDILDYSWNYSYTSRQYGGKIYQLGKSIKEHKVTLSVRAKTKEEYYDALEAFYRVVDTDVLMNRPGRFYVNDSYLQCYILASTKTEWEADVDSLDNEIKIVAEHPFWIQEKVNIFPVAAKEIIEYEYLEYPYDYSFDYMPSRSNFFLLNDHFVNTKFLMQFHGPCRNPMVRVGENVYGINVDIPDGFIGEIDSVNKEVRLIDGKGAKTNIFHLRTTENNVFADIPIGKQSVQKAGAFDLTIVLKNERSEPSWNYS